MGHQCYSGMDSSPRHRQYDTPGIHRAEGGHKIWGEAQLRRGGEEQGILERALVSSVRDEFTNRCLMHGLFWEPCSCGSQCWSIVTEPAALSPTSLLATPMPFRSLLKTSVGSAKQPPSQLTLPTSRKQVRKDCVSCKD